MENNRSSDRINLIKQIILYNSYPFRRDDIGYHINTGDGDVITFIMGQDNQPTGHVNNINGQLDYDDLLTLNQRIQEQRTPNQPIVGMPPEANILVNKLGISSQIVAPQQSVNQTIVPPRAPFPHRIVTILQPNLLPNVPSANNLIPNQYLPVPPNSIPFPNVLIDANILGNRSTHIDTKFMTPSPKPPIVKHILASPPKPDILPDEVIPNSIITKLPNTNLNNITLNPNDKPIINVLPIWITKTNLSEPSDDKKEKPATQADKFLSKRNPKADRGL